jgi:hypothetical protein
MDKIKLLQLIQKMQQGKPNLPDSETLMPMQPQAQPMEMPPQNMDIMIPQQAPRPLPMMPEAMPQLDGSDPEMELRRKALEQLKRQQ